MPDEKDKTTNPSETTALNTVRKMTAGSGIAARRQTAPQVETDVTKFPNRISLIFDDSGSMCGSAIEDAKQGVSAWLQQLNPNDTGVAIVPLCAEPQKMINNMAQLMMYATGLKATGGTPIFAKLKYILEKGDSNHIILFSDGGPTDRNAGSNNFFDNDETAEGDQLPIVSARLKAAGIPVDTCFIGATHDTCAAEFMKQLAELTDGIFMHFTGPETFKSGLKYLSPGKRFMLANAEIKAKIQRGEVI